ncbi:MAG: hypothetical protein M1816_000076 [Peltula sp. TS41687]|nr:MAG: hypothetical protein M1816_000076 [Peltula sp. TS41687]
MSQELGAKIYYGAWTNWSHGRILGATITLSTRSGGLLTAFLAIFVAAAGAALWRILAFIAHQARTSQSPQDGLHHQQQVILRNTGSSGVASWEFLQLAYAWWRLAKRPFWRSLPLVLLALINMIAFAVAGVFSAEVTKAAGTSVLVKGNLCGNWTLNSTDASTAFVHKTVNDTVTAMSYARSCYGGTYNPIQCNQYVKQSLPYTINRNDTCPFASNLCLRSDKGRYYRAPISLDTGNLSSHDDLGINSEAKNKILYRRKTTCAPLGDTGYITTFNYTEAQNQSLGYFNGQPGDVIDFFNFGPINGSRPTNFTFSYNRRAASVGYGYAFDAVDFASGDGPNNSWTPIEALFRNDADVSLIFLSANDIIYAGKIKDPIFQATTESKTFKEAGNNVTFYTTDYCIYGRGASALRAQEVVRGLFSEPLPDNQWQAEVEYWFTIGLAKLQRYIVSYAAGVPFYAANVSKGTYISKPSDAASQYVCDNQKVQVTGGTISFSTLGVVLIVIFGGLLIGTSLVLDPIIGLISKHKKKKKKNAHHRHRQWAVEEKLQLQRLAFEGAGLGTWSNGNATVPITRPDEKFEVLRDVTSAHMGEETSTQTLLSRSSGRAPS